MQNFVLNALVVLPVAIAVTAIVFAAYWRRNVHTGSGSVAAKVGKGQIVSAVVISGALLALLAGAVTALACSGASIVSIIQEL